MTSAPAGGRGNGLPAGSGWVPVGECDPRLAEVLLAELAAASIPAYAVPSPGPSGGQPERRPARLFVDAGRRDEARRLIRQRAPELGAAAPGPVPPAGTAPDSDDEAFASIVADFSVTPAHRDWPASEDLGSATERAEGAPRPPQPWRPASPDPGLLDPGGLLHDSPLGEGHRRRRDDPFAGDDHHYRPPPAGPAPRMRPLTRAAVAAIGAGLLLLLAPGLGLFSDTRVADLLGAALITAGVVGLVTGMRDGPRDGGPDDGAVV